MPPQFLGTNSQKKKVQFKGPVSRRVCDGWRWQRMLAVETCRVTWCGHQFWWPRAEPQSVQQQNPPRVWTLWQARHPALQPRHSRRGRPRLNPWTATTTTQGLTTTTRACIRPQSLKLAVGDRARTIVIRRPQTVTSPLRRGAHAKTYVCPRIGSSGMQHGYCNTDTTRRDHA